jgi:copper transport protein
MPMKIIQIWKPMYRLSLTFLAGIFLGALALSLQPVHIVQAHPDLDRSEPAANSILQQPPGRVVLWFAEAVDIKFSGIKVLDAANKEWDNGDIAVYQNDPSALTVSLPKLPDGIYTVAWHNTSAVDGHSLSGSFAFYVGITPAGVPATTAQNQPLLQSPFEPFLHWIQLFGIIAALGALIFEVFITRSVLAVNSAAAFREMGLKAEYRTLLVVLVGSGLSLAGSLGELFTKAIVAGTTLQSLPLGSAVQIILQTYWGHFWIWRVLVLLVLVGVAVLVLVDWSPQRPGRRPWQISAIALCAGVLFLYSMVGHDAAVTAIRTTAVFTDYIHLLAASVWVGGIIYLAVVMPPAMKLYRRSIKDVGSGAFCPTSHIQALRRFSFLALFSAGVLVITGLYSAWSQVTILRALGTPYGITLLVKVGFVLILAVLGAVNLMWVRPRLADDRQALFVLSKATGAQAVLSVVILLSVGILISLNPARLSFTSNQITTLGYGVASVAEPSFRTGMILWGIEVLAVGLLIFPAWWLTNRFNGRRATKNG